MLKLISVLYNTGCHGGLDVCDVIYEEGSREVWRREGGSKFFFNIAWRHLRTIPTRNLLGQYYFSHQS